MRERGLLLRILTIAGAWLPFLVFWVFFFIFYGGETLGQALPWGALTIGSAAILGVGVWRFCAFQPWPTRMRPSFYVRHLEAASMYAVGWILALYGADALVRGRPLFQVLASSPILGWQFLMGVWLYGVVAGVSYGIQTQRRANDSERRAISAEGALAAARLEALRSRLNPHFLFNALHTVSALVRQEPGRAESAVEKLGDMLRYTLREDSGDTVPFRDEWEFTERYVEFEQLRFGDRLKVESDIDPRALDCPTPAFSLQTLVENAVRHSIASRVEGGRVEITARVEGESFRLRVRDDGNGSAREERADSAHGYGLRALRERLEAVYGDGARLAVTAGEGSGYEVSVTMPCQPREREEEPGGA
jgi:signal transduction histidine kinase